MAKKPEKLKNAKKQNTEKKTNHGSQKNTKPKNQKKT